MIFYRNNRRLTLLILITFLLMMTSCAKGAGLDRLTHKEVNAGSRKILVNRFTDNVNYYWVGGKWERPQAAARATLQALYEGTGAPR